MFMTDSLVYHVRGSLVYLESINCTIYWNEILEILDFFNKIGIIRLKQVLNEWVNCVLVNSYIFIHIRSKDIILIIFNL